MIVFKLPRGHGPSNSQCVATHCLLKIISIEHLSFCCDILRSLRSDISYKRVFHKTVCYNRCLITTGLPACSFN